MSTQFLAYAISFFVLARRWVALAKLADSADTVGDPFVLWSLTHLFLIACIPFATMVVGRYGDLAPAVWIYAANTILAALAMLRLVSLARVPAGEGAEWRGGLIALIVVALISVAISLVRPSEAMWAYLLLAAAPAWQRRAALRKS